jgi:nitrogen-specific signal transduction histidine kinase
MNAKEHISALAAESLVKPEGFVPTMDFFPFAVAVLTNDFHLLQFNQHFQTLFAHQEATYLRSFFCLIHPDEHEEWLQRFSALMCSGNSQTFLYLPHAVDRSTECTFQLSLYKISVPEPAIAAILLVADPFIMQEQYSLWKTVDDKQTAIQRVIRRYTHDLGNMVGVLMSTLDSIRLLERRNGDSLAPYDSSLQVIEKQVKEMANYLLRTGKPCARFEPGFLPIDWQELFDGAQSTAVFQYPGSEHQISLQIPDSLPEYHGHFSGLQETVACVMLNALEAAGREGQVSVILSYDSVPNRFLISIQDNGLGIRPEFLPQIFDAYFTTKINASSGLSLAVAYHVVHQHHGWIRVSTERDMGTRVLIILPGNPSAKFFVTQQEDPY